MCHKPNGIVIKASGDTLPHLADLIDHRVTPILRHAFHSSPIPGPNFSSALDQTLFDENVGVVKGHPR